MSGLRSRRKGVRVEYLARDQLIAAGLPARKVSRAYQSGHDVGAVVGGRTLKVQVKGRARGYATIYQRLDGADVLVIKADRKAALVILPLALAAEILRGMPARNITKI